LFVIQAIGACRQRDGLDLFSLQEWFDALADPGERAVCVGIGLKIRDGSAVRPFSAHRLQASLILFHQRWRSDDTVPAAMRRAEQTAASALCPIAVRTGKARIQRHFRHLAMKSMTQVMVPRMITLIVIRI